MLEELGLPYEVRPVNIRAREQFAPEVVALNPYGKIPILVEDGRRRCSRAAPSCCTWRRRMAASCRRRRRRRAPRRSPG
jgi:hypothetical protein